MLAQERGTLKNKASRYYPSASRRPDSIMPNRAYSTYGETDAIWSTVLTWTLTRVSYGPRERALVRRSQGLQRPGRTLNPDTGVNLANSELVAEPITERTPCSVKAVYDEDFWLYRSTQRRSCR